MRDELQDRQLNFRLPEEHLIKLKVRAALENMTPSEYMRDMVAELIADVPTVTLLDRTKERR